MPFRPLVREKCPTCNRTIFGKSVLTPEGTDYHKECFKCATCGSNLDEDNFEEAEGGVFCNNCSGKETEGGVKADEPVVKRAPEPKQEPKVEEEIEEVEEEEAIPEPETCQKCGKPVSDAERVVGVNPPWHKKCLNCQVCYKSLDANNLRLRDDKPFCRSCYLRKFGRSG